jgi:hypothetical protein
MSGEPPSEPPPAPRTPAVRPAFVLVLALVALPILVLFGAEMVTEDELTKTYRLGWPQDQAVRPTVDEGWAPATRSLTVRVTTSSPVLAT